MNITETAGTIIVKQLLLAEGRTAHNNGWNGANGMASNTWKPCV
jgi:hypothetical protein